MTQNKSSGESPSPKKRLKKSPSNKPARPYKLGITKQLKDALFGFESRVNAFLAAYAKPVAIPAREPSALDKRNTSFAPLTQTQAEVKKLRGQQNKVAPWLVFTVSASNDLNDVFSILFSMIFRSDPYKHELQIHKCNWRTDWIGGNL